MIMCLPALLLFLFCTFHVSLSSNCTVVDSTWCDHYSYRRTLSVSVPTGGVSHTSESFLLDTWTMVTSDQLRFDCSDIQFVFFSASSGPISLEWWSETVCPSTGLITNFTRIWVNIPSEVDFLGAPSRDIYLFYGLSDDFEELSNIERLFWDFGSEEVRFYDTTCGDGFSLENGWDDYFPVGTTQIAGNSGTLVSGMHSHGFYEANLVVTPASYWGARNNSHYACQSAGGTETILRAPHAHSASSTGVGFLTTEESNLRPMGYALMACRGTSTGYRLPFSGGGGSLVGLFEVTLPSTPGLGWVVETLSEGRHLLVSTTTGQQFMQGHGHDTDAYTPGSWSLDFLDADEDGIAGVGPAWSCGHDHTVTNLDIPNQGALVEPSHNWIRMYSRTDDSEIRLDLRSHDPKLKGMVHFFIGSLPPLAFEVIPESVGRTLKGLPNVTTEVPFASPVDPSDHFHVLATTSETASGPNPCDVSLAMYPSPHMSPCLLNMYLPTTSHHHNLSPSQSEITNVPGNLPDHVKLLFARRYDVEREITVTKTEGLNDPEDPGPDIGDPNELTPVYVGVGVGLGVTVIAVFVIFLVVVVLLVIFVVIPKQKATAEEKELKEVAEKQMADLKLNLNLFKIEYAEIKVGKKIGEGGSQASVFRAQWAGQEVAFKCFSLSDFLSDDERFAEFEKEVKVMGSLAHPHILRFFGATIMPPRCGIVVEFCELGDFEAFVKHSECDLETRIRLLHETASAMLFLHQKQVMHRDLKPENVLIDKHVVAKVCDFGLSKIIQDKDRARTKAIGTSYYMAPELFSDAYGFEVDVFAFGVMLYTILMGDFKPYGIALHPEVKVAADPECRPAIRELDLPEACRWTVPLMKSCWDHLAAARPSFSSIVQSMAKHASASAETADHSSRESSSSSDD